MGMDTHRATTAPRDAAVDDIVEWLREGSEEGHRRVCVVLVSPPVVM